MHKDIWIVKVILGAGAVLIAASDLTFGGEPVSPSVLLLVGALTLAEGLGRKPKPGDKD